MRFILLALLPLLAIFLQSTLFASYSIKGVVPDMVLVFVIFYALLNGAEKGARYGLICGLLEDLYTGRFIGMNALSKAATAYIIGKLQGRVFEENVAVGIIGVILGSLLNACLFFILAFAYFAVFNIDRSLFINIIYQSFYNVVITTPIYLWYYQSSKRGLLKETGER
ncbi:MAG TPA: rod shape-determining protein MreD [Syntrophomonas sp.]|nr:rod shape-determining protein MreD [Syntrophomonas sp.]